MRIIKSIMLSGNNLALLCEHGNVSEYPVVSITNQLTNEILSDEAAELLLAQSIVKIRNSPSVIEDEVKTLGTMLKCLQKLRAVRETLEQRLEIEPLETEMPQLTPAEVDTVIEDELIDPSVDELPEKDKLIFLHTVSELDTEEKLKDLNVVDNLAKNPKDDILADKIAAMKAKFNNG